MKRQENELVPTTLVEMYASATCPNGFRHLVGKLGGGILLKQMLAADKLFVLLRNIVYVLGLVCIGHIVAHLTLNFKVFEDENEVLSSLATFMLVLGCAIITYYESLGDKVKNFHEAMHTLGLRYSSLYCPNFRYPWNLDSMKTQAHTLLKQAAEEIVTCEKAYRTQNIAYKRELEIYLSKPWWKHLFEPEPLAPSQVPVVNAKSRFSRLHKQMLELGLADKKYDQYFPRG
jgi:hypothetical protein